jgi:hypothetical protein
MTSVDSASLIPRRLDEIERGRWRSAAHEARTVDRRTRTGHRARLGAGSLAARN